MTKFKSTFAAVLLTLSLSVTAFSRGGTISTTSAGTISTTSAGTISTTSAGTISTTRDRSLIGSRIKADSWGLMDLLYAFYQLW